MTDKRRVHEFVVSVVVPDGMTTVQMVDVIRRLVVAGAPTYFSELGAVRVRHVPKVGKPRKGG